MNKFSRAVICVLPLSFLCGCSLGQQFSFVPVDSSKYATQESLQTALKQAQRECSSLKNKKGEHSAINVMKAIHEQNANTRQTYVACMKIRGFVEQAKPSAQ